MPKDRNPTRGQLLKRKRPQDTKNVHGEVLLENHNSDSDIFQIPENDVMINGINKLKTGPKHTESSQRSAAVCLLVSTTEADYLAADNALDTRLKVDLKIGEFSISSPIDGSIDRFVYVSGDLVCVLRAAVYLSFLLAARVSSVARLQPFTLKSANYSLTLVTKKLSVSTHKFLAENGGARRFECSSYALNPEATVLYIGGDLACLFNFLVVLTSSSILAPEEAQLHPADIYANVNRAGLYKRSQENDALLSLKSHDIIRHV